MVISIVVVFIINLLLGVPLFASLLISAIVGFAFIDLSLASIIILNKYLVG
ncbi:hypothetical protein JCM19239_7377 [Vibrio variabilis]|uniref:Uncharacterized protein n=1 Tax=Vibrio variabilis TaxID=990271 RepID=A0ABQ0J7N4_9VIBR|nr:hypothetical protein JCM19239_7377 [Vibrio variabilis]